MTGAAAATVAAGEGVYRLSLIGMPPISREAGQSCLADDSRASSCWKSAVREAQASPGAINRCKKRKKNRREVHDRSPLSADQIPRVNVLLTLSPGLLSLRGASSRRSRKLSDQTLSAESRNPSFALLQPRYTAACFFKEVAIQAQLFQVKIVLHTSSRKAILNL